MDINNKKLCHTIKDAISKNIDFIIKTLTVGGTILAMLSVILYLKTDIKTQIYEKLNSKDVILKIAKEIKPHFVIFDSNGNVIHNDGCEDYLNLDEFEINREKFKLNSIIISTKKYLEIPPIVSSIDAEIYFHKAKRISAYKWQFDAVELDRVYFSKPDGGVPVGRFRLEIIR